jgi:flagellar biosynthesis/type III secretory pathway protein FliH
MKHKIIQIENYLLVVDDSEIKEGDYYLFTWGGEQDIQRFQNQEEDKIKHQRLYETTCKKIIAHLPLNNSPILEGVDLLPPLEDEVEKLFRDEHEQAIKRAGQEYAGGYYEGLHKGYNKAKEKYNKNLIDWIDNISNSIFAFQANEIELKMLEQFKNKVKSLQQPKIPFGFEREIKKTKGRLMVIPPCKHCIKPKTITNSQGITQWVGKYIFD